MTTTASTTITIRPAHADDQRAVARLADLDSAEEMPLAPLLLAEIDGKLRAALSLRSDEAIADPFYPTSDIVDLLRTHAAAATSGGRRRRTVRERRALYHGGLPRLSHRRR